MEYSDVVSDCSFFVVLFESDLLPFGFPVIVFQIKIKTLLSVSYGVSGTVILNFYILLMQNLHFGSPVLVFNVDVLLYCLAVLKKIPGVSFFPILKTLSMIPGIGAWKVCFCDDADSWKRHPFVLEILPAFGFSSFILGVFLKTCLTTCILGLHSSFFNNLDSNTNLDPARITIAGHTILSHIKLDSFKSKNMIKFIS